jgi:hypothetical protein
MHALVTGTNSFSKFIRDSSSNALMVLRMVSGFIGESWNALCVCLF